jgi:hypothetical protein
MLVTARNIYGSTTWMVSEGLAVTQPTLMDMLLHVQSGVGDLAGANASAGGSVPQGDALVTAAVQATLQQMRTEGSDAIATLSAVSSATMVLGLSECLSWDCGNGTCRVGAVGAYCDCRGTNATGPFCSGDIDSPTSDAQGIPAEQDVKACPSTGREDCSGHGMCVRDRSPCAAASLDCRVECR